MANTPPKAAFETAFESRVDLKKRLHDEDTHCLRVATEAEIGFTLDAFFDPEGQSCVLFAAFLKAGQAELPWQEVVNIFNRNFSTTVIAIGGALKELNASRSLDLIWRQSDQMAGQIKDMKGPGFVTKEFGIQYLIQLDQVLNPGLFLDQRANRRLLLQNLRSAPGPLLNLFSYTGAFSVLANSVGISTVSVDVSRRYLKWEEQNYQINRFSCDSRRITEDALLYLERLKRRSETRFSGNTDKPFIPFRWVIIDPPTFSKSAEGDS